MKVVNNTLLSTEGSKIYENLREVIRLKESTKLADMIYLTQILWILSDF